MSNHHKKGNLAWNMINHKRRRKIKMELVRDCGKVCGYCFKNKKIENLTIDHIQPLSKGGTDKKENMILACRDCNALKADMDISSWIQFLGWQDELKD